MPHIHTAKNQHDLTVTAYIVRIDGVEPKALLHMHRKLNVLLPVGGHVELNETPWQAIDHELTEESGYDLSQLEILQPKSRIKEIAKAVQHPYPIVLNTHYIPNDHFHTDLGYGFIAKNEPSNHISEGESADLRWLSLAEIFSLPPELIFDGTKEIYRFIIEEALSSWDNLPADSFLGAFPKEYKL